MTYDDNDNDGRFPDDSRVEVCYPRTRQEEQGDRAAWPWLPGSIVEQCGPDEWQVCVEDRDVAVLQDGLLSQSASRGQPYHLVQVALAGRVIACQVVSQLVDHQRGILAEQSEEALRVLDT
jgi:hypothetical protein